MEVENLIKLIQTVSESELTGFKYEEKGMKLHLTKQRKKVSKVPKEEAIYLKSKRTDGEGDHSEDKRKLSGNLRWWGHFMQRRLRMRLLL